jgi:hypothetical protein
MCNCIIEGENGTYNFLYKESRNCLYSYLKQTKMSFFKNGEQEGKIGSVWGLVLVGGGRI